MQLKRKVILTVFKFLTETLFKQFLAHVDVFKALWTPCLPVPLLYSLLACLTAPRFCSGYFYLRSLPLKGTTWIPRGPPSFDTSTSLTMSLGDGDGWKTERQGWVGLGGEGVEGRGEGWHHVGKKQNRQWDDDERKKTMITTTEWCK